jgi:hypothetical protein
VQAGGRFRRARVRDPAAVALGDDDSYNPVSCVYSVSGYRTTTLSRESTGSCRWEETRGFSQNRRLTEGS